MARCAARRASSAADCAASACFTSAASALARSRTAGRSSAEAPRTDCETSFWEARRLSARVTAARRSSSAFSRASTSAGSSPRAVWEARTRSGSWRRSLRSITLSGYRRENRPRREFPVSSSSRGCSAVRLA